MIIVDRRFDQARCVIARNGRLFASAQPLRSIVARWELGTRRRGQLGKLASGRIQIPVHARRIAESPQSDTYARNAGRVITDRAAHARCDARECHEQCSRTREEAGALEFHSGWRLKMGRQWASFCSFSPSTGRTRGDSNRRSPAHGPLHSNGIKSPGSQKCSGPRRLGRRQSADRLLARTDPAVARSARFSHFSLGLVLVIERSYGKRDRQSAILGNSH